MSRGLSTMLMAVILGGLGAYLYFFELPAERAKEQQETTQARLLLFDEATITGLAIRSSSGEVSLELDQDRRWHITAPIHAEANAQEVGALLRALVLGRISRTFEEELNNLASFGLEEPSIVVKVIASSEEETISLGDSGPLSSTLYAKRGSDNKVLLTNLAPKDFLNKTLTSFRDNNVLSFDQAQVERFRLTYQPNEFVLYRTTHEGKTTWRIRSPVEAPADQIEIKGLLVRLQDLNAIGFIDPGPRHDRLTKTFGTPNIQVTLRISGSDKVLKLFQPDPSSGEAFAVTQPDKPIYRISPLSLKDFTKDLFSLRDKRLLGLELEDMAILDVRTGESHYELVHQNTQWVLEDQPQAALNREELDLFISRVINLPAELSVPEGTSPLAAYGLDPPNVEFTARDRKGNRHRLALGKRVGGLVYATGEGLSGVYQARSDILDQIPARADLLKKSAKKDGATS